MADAGPDQETQAELLRQLAELRAAVDALRREAAARQRITLRVLQERPYLGQAVNLVAAVSGADGAPAVDAPVTLTTTWGRLRTSSGAVHEAGSVALRTGADGAARALLVPPTPADLTPAQQAALEIALRTLDPAARTPEAAADGLRALARQYRWDGNPELRQAIDVYFRELRPGTRESAARLPGEPWATVDAVVLAFARDGSTADADVLDTAVLATAALPLRFTDWLDPWMQALLSLSQEESTLDRELTARRPRGDKADADSLLGHVYGRVRDFVADQKGAVGERVGRKVAEQSLQRFLDTGLQDVPAAIHAAVLPGIEAASGTLTTAGVGVLTAVGQTHRDLSRAIDRKIATVPKVDLTPVTGRLDQLTAAVATKAERADLTRFDAAVTRLDTGLSTVNATLARKAEKDDLDRVNTNLLREIGTIKDGTRRITDHIAEIDTAVAAKADREAVNVEIGKLNDRSGRIEQQVTTIDGSVRRIDTAVGRIQILRPPG